MVSTAARALRDVAHRRAELAQSGLELDLPAGAAGRQGLEPLHALGQCIECARIAAQRILRLERNALEHQAQLLGGRRNGRGRAREQGERRCAQRGTRTISAEQHRQ